MQATCLFYLIGCDPHRLIQMGVVMVLMACITGCGSTKTYFLDRGRDATDIFTVAGGLGLGGKARIGPVHAGAIIYPGDVGLYAGDIVECSGGSCNHVVGMELIGWSWEQMYPMTYPDKTSTNRLKSKSYIAASPILPFITTDFEPYDSSYRRFPHPYWTQCEVQLGLLASVRLGFNVGELLDFILGWTTLDIYADDTSRAADMRESNHASDGIRQPADGAPKPSR